MTASKVRAAVRLQQASRFCSGLTLIELMVVIALIGVILALAAPSMREMIDMRRLRAINAQLVTDMQFARSEAVARRVNIRVGFRDDTEKTCYTLYTAPTNVLSSRCNCLLGEGNACTAPSVEIKTVVVPRSSRVTIGVPQGSRSFAFEPTMGSLLGIPVDQLSNPIPGFDVDTAIDAARTLRVAISQAGRPTVCAPPGSHVSESAC
jgi:type IV fimbrial biogenesis protein FimT